MLGLRRGVSRKGGGGGGGQWKKSGLTEEGEGGRDTVEDGHVRDGADGGDGEADEEADAPCLVLSLVEPWLLVGDKG